MNRRASFPITDDKVARGGVALVTGACSGIGLCLSRGLAARGYDLVLASNRADEIARVAAEIAADHGVRTHPLALDLARSEAAAELYEAVKALGLEVDVLVNNAGFFFFGEAVDADPSRARAMLELHVVTPALLCTRFGRDMRARRRGHILMVSSISAWRDFPGIAYYGASKKFLRGFARSLRSDMAPYNVSVTCLAPGATATGLYDPNVVPVERAKKLGVMMAPEDVAEAGLRALFKGRAECIPGLLTRLMTWGSVVTPQFVIDLIRRRGRWMRPDQGAR